jgi:hypothetical protein
MLLRENFFFGKRKDNLFWDKNELKGRQGGTNKKNKLSRVLKRKESPRQEHDFLHETWYAVKLRLQGLRPLNSTAEILLASPRSFVTRERAVVYLAQRLALGFVYGPVFYLARAGAEYLRATTAARPKGGAGGCGALARGANQHHLCLLCLSSSWVLSKKELVRVLLRGGE